MQKHSDRSVPIVCVCMAVILIGVAYFLWDTNTRDVDGAGFDFSDINIISNIDNSLQEAIGLAGVDASEDGLLKIAIVPGHDEENYGAKYLDITEQELNVIVAEKLHKLLSKSDIENIEIILLRDSDGYDSDFLKYVTENSAEISNFRDFYEKFTANFFAPNQIEPLHEIRQVSAPEEVSLKLHGINKWANENKIDVVLHLHFNDYPDRGKWQGKYSGFSIYIPHVDYKNHDRSLLLAQKIRENLQTEFSESNLEVESDIIIEDSDLIAIGANNSLKSAAALIEYGYIYEPQFNGVKRDEVFDLLAEKTYLGILDFFTATQ